MMPYTLARVRVCLDSGPLLASSFETALRASSALRQAEDEGLKRSTALILVTWIAPNLLELAIRWRMGDRLILGQRSPYLSRVPHLSFH